jgi:hypothetical protein
MDLFIAITIAAGIGFWLLTRQSKRTRRSAPIVLSAMPLALLFLIAPIPIGAVRAVRAFQVLGNSHHAGISDAAGLATGILRPLWFGSWGFVIALAVAAGLQRRLARSPTSDRSNPGWGTWIILVSLVPIIPATILTPTMQDVPSLLMQTAVQLPTEPGVTSAATAATMTETSEAISSRLTIAALRGFPILLFTIAVGIGNVIVVSFSQSSDRLDRLSWTLWAAVGAYALWNAISVSVRLRGLERMLG